MHNHKQCSGKKTTFPHAFRILSAHSSTPPDVVCVCVNAQGPLENSNTFALLFFFLTSRPMKQKEDNYLEESKPKTNAPFSRAHSRSRPCASRTRAGDNTPTPPSTKAHALQRERQRDGKMSNARRRYNGITHIPPNERAPDASMTRMKGGERLC